MTLTVRPAAAGDAAAIAAIYRHHVTHGTASFDTEGLTDDQWQAKIAEIEDRNWPFLVADEAGRIAGYAYATQIRDRAAYWPTCEDSIYIAPDRLGHGVGTRLLSALIDAARRAGFEQMIAVIGGAEPASEALHAKFGFVERGRLRDVGRKFGKKLDSLYMQLAL